MRWMAVMGLGAALGLAGCGEAGSAPAGGAAAAEAAPAPSLPQVDADDLKALVADSAAADRVVVLDFWATWCEPCKTLYPALKEALAPLGERVRKVSVTLDAPGEYELKAIEFLRQHDGLKDAYLLDPDADEQERAVRELGKEWNTLVVPAILVFDTRGELVGEFFGADAEPIVASVREALEGSSESARAARG